MSAILVPSLYFTSGICAYTAVRHGLSVWRRRANATHLLFALSSLFAGGFIMARAGAYSAQSAAELVTMRRWEITLTAGFCMAFSWFIASYTRVRPRKLLLGMAALWVSLTVLNLKFLPFGVQFTDLPRLSYFHLPWGESVVDLRVPDGGLWHHVGWLGVITMLGYGLYASYAQYRNGGRDQSRALALAWAMGLFAAFALFNIAVNRGLVEFIHTSDFGILALIVLMDWELAQESRDHNRRMHAVLDHLPAAVCLTDLGGRFQMVNRKFEAIFHTSETALMGKTTFDLFAAHQAEAARALARRALETRQDIESVEVLDLEGETCTFQSIKFPLFRRDGTAYGVGSVYTDITESMQKDEMLGKLRRQVWHADRVASTGAITASLAHELCQPLFAILSNAQAGLRFLGQDKVNLDEIRELLEDIVRDEKRAGSVINGLRAMLQQQDLPLADMDLVQCIKEVVDLLHTEFVRHDVKIENTLEANLTVHANRTQIQQVLLNLMINALEAMAEHPNGERSLQVKAGHVDGKAWVSVRDSGPGIAPDMLDRVFAGFYTTKPQGLGVGLEVCRSIIELHNGKIWAEANPDRGVTFHFTLPLAASVDAAAPSAQQGAA